MRDSKGKEWEIIYISDGEDENDKRHARRGKMRGKIAWERSKGKKTEDKGNGQLRQQRIEDMSIFDGLPKPVFRRRDVEGDLRESGQERSSSLRRANLRSKTKFPILDDNEDIRESIKRWEQRNSLGSLDNSIRRYEPTILSAPPEVVRR